MTRVWDQFRSYVVRRADHAGGSTTPWLIVSLLAAIELVGVSPVTTGWPREFPSVTFGVDTGALFVWRFFAGLVGSSDDPFAAWSERLLPGDASWLAVAAVPLIIAVLVAVLREHRSQSHAGRALRLATAVVVYCVVVLYLRHLVVTLLGPIANAIANINLILVVIVAGGIVGIVGATVREASRGQRLPGRRFTNGLLTAAALVVAIMVARLVPLPN